MASEYVPVYTKEDEAALAEEFKNILQGRIYLDHAGATLYSQKQIDDIHTDLSRNLFGNPHSKSVVSKTTEDLIDTVRYQILDFFSTTPEDYSIIFTSGATASLKLVAETFDYQDGRLIYLQETHTSVLGMREYAKRHSSFSSENVFRKFAKFTENECNRTSENEYSHENCKNNLFVYPAQCNFSGFKYPLEWIQKSQNGCLNNNDPINEHWYCMLDASSFAATNPLDLSKYKPDFVCLSFYKLFGYPTGIGGLLVKNTSGKLLKKKYFGGGTVSMALANEDTVIHRSNLHEKFEDGTISFLSIAALRHGFATLQRHNLEMATIQRHTFKLAQYVYNSLKKIKHFNGQPSCVLYHDKEFEDVECQGGIVNFNILRSDGSYIGFAEVMHIANLYNISLRTGCFCNPGACQRHLEISSEEVQYYYEMGHVCGDQRDLIDGKPTGSVRVSFGYMSTKGDADALLNMIRACFIQTRSPHQKQLIEPLGINHDIDLKKAIFGTVDKIFIYPIKSCAALEVTYEWDLVSTGLLYDREWMIVNQDAVCITQKHETRMCLIKPKIDLKSKQLILYCENEKNSIAVDLDMNYETYRCHSKVCGDRIQGWDCGDEVALWLDRMLQRNGLRLIRQFDRNVKKQAVKLSLVNEAQFLLINKASVKWLFDRVPENGDCNEGNESFERSIARFRPNLLMDFKKPFVENQFKEIYVRNMKFIVQGKCTRCQMICIDQFSGLKTVEPLRTLSRELQGKNTFGIYLQMHQTGSTIAPAMETTAICDDSSTDM